MTSDVLKKKTARYLCGESHPAEKDQIQTWLSCTGDKKINTSPGERTVIENEIVAQVNAYVVSSQLVPAKSVSWWRKITACF
jgi:hypothetical protein